MMVVVEIVQNFRDSPLPEQEGEDEDEDDFDPESLSEEALRRRKNLDAHQKASVLDPANAATDLRCLAIVRAMWERVMGVREQF